MEILIYAAKVSVYWIVLYGCFWLFLRKQTFFHWSRGFLLSALLISLLLPFLKLRSSAPVQVAQVSDVMMSQYMVIAPQTNSPTNHALLWSLFYLTVSGLLAFKLIRELFRLKKLLAGSEVIEMENYTLYLLPDDRCGSFSFLNKIVVNQNDYAHHFDTILNHEIVHLRQKHSFDVLFVEILKIVFWFNPVLQLYKRSLQQMHEYLADEKSDNRESYARFLFTYATTTHALRLTNNFFHSSILRNRIVMLYKRRNSKWELGKYLAVIPIISTLFFLTAAREKIIQTIDLTVSESITAVAAATEGRGEALSFSSVEQENQNSKTLDFPSVANSSKSEKSIKSETKEIEFKARVTEKEPAAPVFSVVEQSPEFPGGLIAMTNFLRREAKYPATAAKAHVQGRVFLSFVVSAQGDIGDIQITKGLGFGLDAEAVRLVNSMPRWQPGKQNGLAVAVRFNLPINFVLALQEETTPDQQKPPTTLTLKGRDPERQGNETFSPPLILLNGQEYNGSLESVQSDAIESVSVLKGAAATSSFGAKGQNGVLQIKLKD